MTWLRKNSRPERQDEPAENEDLKKRLSQMYRLCDQLEETALRPGGIEAPHGSLRNTLWYDLIYLLFRLSQADGQIKASEAAFISMYMHWKFKPRRIQEIVMENEIYTKNFVLRVPASVRLFVAAENLIREKAPEKTTDYSLRLLRLIEAIGQEFLLIDFEKDWQEERDLNAYLETSNRYIEKYLKKSAKA